MAVVFYNFYRICDIAKVVFKRQIVIAPVRITPIKQVDIQTAQCQEISNYTSSRIQVHYVEGVNRSINYQKRLPLLLLFFFYRSGGGGGGFLFVVTIM